MEDLQARGLSEASILFHHKISSTNGIGTYILVKRFILFGVLPSQLIYTICMKLTSNVI